MVPGIPLASSKRYHDVDPRACCPWYASAFSGAHEIGAQNHCSRNPLRYMMTELISNQCPVRHRLVHSMTAAQVFFWSWSPVLAVMVPRVFRRVDINQFTSQAKSAVFPHPFPELMAFRIGATEAVPS